MACPSGAEKIVHGLSCCFDEHWTDGDFAVLKIDLHNAYNHVSRQAILDESAVHFPELVPWAAWCYGQYPILWHTMGSINSETGVQHAGRPSELSSFLPSVAESSVSIQY